MYFADQNVLNCTLEGHTNAVWGLSVHSSKMQLLSCSADGTVRLWSPGQKPPLLQSYTAEEGRCPTLARYFHYHVIYHHSDVCLHIHVKLSLFYLADDGAPTSVDFVRCDPSQMVASYSSSNTYIYDIETGKQVLCINTKSASGKYTRVNQLR